MSERLRKAWIYDFLVEIGEQMKDGSLFKVQESLKNGKSCKSVQLIEFLTYTQDREDSDIWAVTSDKWHTIPVRFSAEALREYRISVGPDGKRLTEHRNALITIKKFYPFFGRVPRGKHGPGMTEKERFALHVDCVKVIGSSGEATWGDPKDVAEEDKVRRWTEGMLQGGGGGNVLSIEREQRALAEAAKQQQDSTRTSLTPVPIDSLLMRKQKPEVKEQIQSVSSKTNRDAPEVPLEVQWKRRWKSHLKTIGAEEGFSIMNVPHHVKDVLRTPPRSNRIDATANLHQENPPVSCPSHSPCAQTPRKRLGVLDLASSSPPQHSQIEDDGSTSSWPRQTTPSRSEWSPSIHGSQRRNSGVNDASDFQVDHDSDELNDESNFGPPNETLAPIKQSDDHPSLPTEPAVQTLAAHHYTPSQIPSGSQTASQPQQQLSSPSVVLPISHRKNVSRKVPYPVPPNPRDPDASGPERILVPNSDISGSGSGSLKWTQSQSQSQSQGVEASQTNILAGLDYSQPKTDVRAVRSRQSSATNGGNVEDAGRSYEGDRSSPDILTYHRGRRRDVKQKDTPAEAEGRNPSPAPNSQSGSKVERPVNGNSRGPHKILPPERFRKDDLSSDDQETLTVMAKKAQARSSQKPSSYSLSGQQLISPPTSASSATKARAGDRTLLPSGSGSRPQRSSNAPTLPSSPDVFIDADNPPFIRYQDSREDESSKNVLDLRNQSSSGQHLGQKLPKVSDNHNENPQAGQDKVPGHDPYAWSQPSFMRKGKGRAVDLSPTPTNSKRKRDRGESVLHATQPANKLRKVDVDKKIPSTPAPAEPSSSRTDSSQNSSHVNENATKPVLRSYLDVRDLQRQRLQHANLRPSRGLLIHPESTSSGPSTSDKGKQRAKEGLAGPSVSKSVTISHGDDSSTRSQTRSATISDRQVRRSELYRDYLDKAELAMETPQQKLAGFTVDLDMHREEGGPPLITWHDLDKILLRTGRIRHSRRLR